MRLDRGARGFRPPATRPVGSGRRALGPFATRRTRNGAMACVHAVMNRTPATGAPAPRVNGEIAVRLDRPQGRPPAASRSLVKAFLAIRLIAARYTDNAPHLVVLDGGNLGRRSPGPRDASPKIEQPDIAERRLPKLVWSQPWLQFLGSLEGPTLLRWYISSCGAYPRAELLNLVIVDTSKLQLLNGKIVQPRLQHRAMEMPQSAS